MRSVVLTPAARQDLIDIWSYIAHDNRRAADRLRVRIEAAFGKLADMPGMGHTRADVQDQRYRFWRVRSYIIAYRYDDTDLTIVRVLHGARDFRRIFRDWTDS